MLEKLQQTINYIHSVIDFEPEIGVILGTGLGGLVDEIQIKTVIPYEDIPHFPVSTVHGHQGRLIFGELSGRKLVAMQGRFHYYEGYSPEELTFPVRVMKLLGVQLLIVSNASGGLNADFAVGDLMFITDHINLMPNPLIGKNDERLGTRFPDMSVAYDKTILKKALGVADTLKIKVHQGVYAAVSGPTFETPAEYYYIRTIGADAVGMSTVPEVIVARHMKLPVFAVSVISDLGVKGKITEISHEEVVDAAATAQPRMTKIIKALLAEDIIQ
ncbi:MAG: purine-nucleoside phosphorylase [Bacteroidetes bacterium]|nr:purine-nucleoside phosphorylase [Bacteroidota bacterium]MBU1580930.1 purine-nucleoside phosphorylase [Bacteroidota bacterium]MBU2466098.1 purine-nucleoside phosphorylase [Bacteroidota bacterium]MBU2559074.1 purine-nucleoside phosphorylase [Bacteroidota bacterium]